MSGYPVTDASQEAEVTDTTAIKAYQHFQDICSWRLHNHDSMLTLGGPGVVDDSHAIQAQTKGILLVVF